MYNVRRERVLFCVCAYVCRRWCETRYTHGAYANIRVCLFVCCVRDNNATGVHRIVWDRFIDSLHRDHMPTSLYLIEHGTGAVV